MVELNIDLSREDWDIKVPIRNELLSGLIFRLDSRLAIAKILSFFGSFHQVLYLLQRLNHSTRAYIVNADGL